MSVPIPSGSSQAGPDERPRPRRRRGARSSSRRPGASRSSGRGITTRTMTTRRSCSWSIPAAASSKGTGRIFYGNVEKGARALFHDDRLGKVLQVSQRGGGRVPRGRRIQRRRRRDARIPARRSDPLRGQPLAPPDPDQPAQDQSDVRHRHGVGRSGPLRQGNLQVPRHEFEFRGRDRRRDADDGQDAGWLARGGRRPGAFVETARAMQRWSLPTRPIFPRVPRIASGNSAAGSSRPRSGVSRIGSLVSMRILSVETWQAHEAIYKAWTALRPSISERPRVRSRSADRTRAAIGRTRAFPRRQGETAARQHEQPLRVAAHQPGIVTDQQYSRARAPQARPATSSCLRPPTHRAAR